MGALGKGHWNGPSEKGIGFVIISLPRGCLSLPEDEITSGMCHPLLSGQLGITKRDSKLIIIYTIRESSLSKLV